MDTLLLALRVLLSLAAVLALLWLLQRRLSKRPRARSGASVSVVGRQSLGRRASAVVVEVDGTRLLLGVTEQQVTVLHSLGTVAPEGAAAGEAQAEPEGAGEPGPIDFARTLSAAEAMPEGPTPDLVPMLRPRRNRTAAGQGKSGQGKSVQAKSVLGNSILAPTTWRQAGAALRHSR